MAGYRGGSRRSPSTPASPAAARPGFENESDRQHEPVAPLAEVRRCDSGPCVAAHEDAEAVAGCRDLLQGGHLPAASRVPSNSDQLVVGMDGARASDDALGGGGTSAAAAKTAAGVDRDGSAGRCHESTTATASISISSSGVERL